MDLTLLSSQQISALFIPVGITAGEYFLLFPTYLQPNLNPDSYRIAYLRERIGAAFTQWKRIYLRDLESQIIVLSDMAGINREVQIKGSSQRDWNYEFYRIDNF